MLMVVDPHTVESGFLATGDEVGSFFHRQAHRNANVYLYSHAFPLTPVLYRADHRNIRYSN